MSGPEVMRHRLGVGLVLASTVPFALAGIFTRLIDADIWSVLAWRGLIGGLMIWLYALAREGRVPLGWRGWVLALAGGTASVAFLAAFRRTSVANVTLIYAMAPFAAAMLDRMIRGAPVRAAVMWSAALSALGVGVIVAGGIGAPGREGDLLALVMMILFALYTVLLRAFPAAPALRAAALSALLLFGAGLVQGAPFTVASTDLPGLLAFGLSFALAVILFTEGALRIMPAEAGLYGGAEVPLAVIFAWVILGEVPPLTTVMGGTLVMCAVLWRGWRDLAG